MATMAKNLRDKFKQLELEYKAKIQNVHAENTRALTALQEKQDKEIQVFAQKQDQEKSEFTKKQILEKLSFETNQTKEKSAFDNEKRAERDQLKEQSTQRLKNTEKFIDEIRFPSNSTLQRRFWGFDKDKQENGGKNAEAWKELECPVCLNEMKPPTRIWQCSQGHAICAPCRKNPAITQCPTCRMGFVGRNTALEKIALALFEETNPPMSPQPTESSPSLPKIGSIGSIFNTPNVANSNPSLANYNLSLANNNPVNTSLANSTSTANSTPAYSSPSLANNPLSNYAPAYRSPSLTNNTPAFNRSLSSQVSSINITPLFTSPSNLCYSSPSSSQLLRNLSTSSPQISQLPINSSNNSSKTSHLSNNSSYRSRQMSQEHLLISGMASSISQPSQPASNSSSCSSPSNSGSETASTQQENNAMTDSDCLIFISVGPSAAVQSSKMGVYRKNSDMYCGFPVYEMLGGDWFLLVNSNMDWVVSREIAAYPTSFLVNRMKPTPQFPPSTGWQYCTETGVWREDPDLTLTPLD